MSWLFTDSIEGFIFTEHFPNSVDVVECHIGIKESPFMDHLEAKYMIPTEMLPPRIYDKYSYAAYNFRRSE